MRLDWHASTQKFTLEVPRTDPRFIQTLMNEHGLMFSNPRSTMTTAVLFTDTPYAAVTFWEYATERAAAELGGLHATIEASQASSHGGRFRCPADLELWPFQKASLAYALGRKHTLIADQPGLGKTPQAIVFANEIKAKKVLVVCPASIRLQWVKKIREWTTMPRGFTVYPILKSSHGVHPDAAWTVISYDLVSHDVIGRALAEQRFDLLILDEAHYLKTGDTRRSRAVFGGGRDSAFPAIASRADRILGLTGTPLPNRPREAYVLSRHLCHDAIDWCSEDDFRSRFNPSMRGQTASGRVYIDERTGRHAELQNRLRGNFMTRHEKRAVMPQLKMPAFDLMFLEETGPVKAALKAEKLLDIDPEDLTGADMTTLGHISIVRKQMGIAMAPQVCNYVDMLIDGGEEKLFVVGHHIEVLDMLERHFAKYGVLRIDGSTSMSRRQARVEAFQNDPTMRIMLGNIQSIGTGVDGLQNVCSHGVLAEASWVPGENQQVIDRLDRGGQKGHVQFDICVVKGSFSEKVMASSLRKLIVTNKVLDRKAEFVS